MKVPLYMISYYALLVWSKIGSLLISLKEINDDEILGIMMADGHQLPTQKLIYLSYSQLDRRALFFTWADVNLQSTKQL